MAIRIERTFTIAASIHRVGRALSSEHYSIEWARMREAVQSAHHVVIHGDLEGQLEYEVRYVEYARTTTGTIDRGKTQHAVTRAVWDAEAQTLRWTYTTEASERFRIEGLYRLTDEGDETRVDYQVTIDVRVPLIGGAIAKRVARSYEETLQRVPALLAKHATRS